MITLKWSKFPGSDVASYRIFRAMIGFKAPIVNISGKDIVLRMNGNTPQTIAFNAMTIVDTINSVLIGGTAYTSNDGLSFFVRSNVRIAPGSVEIVGGAALADLGLTPVLITEKSDGQLIDTKVASVVVNAVETYVDEDGVLDDFYSVSTVSAMSVESLKTPWQQPIQSAGPICVIEGVIADLQGVRIADCEVRAEIVVPPESLSIAYITKDPITTISATDGRFSLPLLQGALVKLEIPEIGYSQMVTVPALSYVFLKDLKVDEAYAFDARPLGTM